MDYSFLARLSETPGIAGREEKVRELMAERFSVMKAEARVDAMGNLIGHIPGEGPRVALIAHMDEIGFMVSRIDDRGFLYVLPVGGVDPLVFWAQKVIVHGRKELGGVVGSIPPHLKKADQDGKGKIPQIEEGFVDLGMSGSEVAELVQIGDPVTYATKSWENDRSFFGKALDDRVGLFVLISSAIKVKQLGCDLYLIASTQEEYGLRGVEPAVHSVVPDILLALEGTVAADVPGVKLPANICPTSQGEGPEIRLTDRRMVSDRLLADFLIRLARELNIPHQVIVKNFGSTDASAGQIKSAGAKACAVSVPARYIHAPISMVRKTDVEHTVALIAAFLERVPEFSMQI